MPHDLAAASTDAPASNSDLSPWELYKQHCLCRSFGFSSHHQALDFVAALCRLTKQHQQELSLRLREDHVFLELDVGEDGISEAQSRFTKDIDQLGFVTAR